ncbi:MAG: hypothetical protein IIV08_01675 [Selenomonadales bacterium]|nr:hypothetical protein [Selenomonadales bacterium]
MRILKEHCIDVNSEYCPCILAEMNHCIMCSQLQGKGSCTCEWNGTCVLYEKHWNGERTRPQKRIEEVSSFSSVETVGDKTVVISFDVSEALAHMLNKVGSFVFLRRKDDDQFYHFPVGVMSVDHTSITVAIEAVGTKSKRLLEDTSAEIIVRGPYYNGMFGQPWLTTIRGESVLLVAGGIGQAPLLPVARELVQGENRITAILAGGKVGVIFVSEELREMGIDVIEVSSLRQEGMSLLRKKLKKGVDFIASCGSDNQHCGIISVLHEMKLDLPMAATNNAVMCCGEGICGSCHHKMKDGRVVKLCKVQADFRELEQD